MIVDTGVVICFDNRPGKMFGYIRSFGGKVIWFHHNNGRLVRFDREANEVVFSKRRVQLRIPHKGDEVCFDECGDIEHPKAKPWAFKKSYQDAIHEARCFANGICPTCLHSMEDHNGNEAVSECTFCDCGTEAYEHEREDVLSTSPSWSTGLGGHEGYEG